MLKAYQFKLKREMLGNLVIAKASTTDMTSEESVQKLNDLIKTYTEMFEFGKKKETRKTKEQMASVFNTLFKDESGNVKPIQFNVGKA